MESDKLLETLKMLLGIGVPPEDVIEKAVAPLQRIEQRFHAAWGTLPDNHPFKTPLNSVREEIKKSL